MSPRSSIMSVSLATSSSTLPDAGLMMIPLSPAGAVASAMKELLRTRPPSIDSQVRPMPQRRELRSGPSLQLRASRLRWNPGPESEGGPVGPPQGTRRTSVGGIRPLHRNLLLARVFVPLGGCLDDARSLDIH